MFENAKSLLAALWKLGDVDVLSVDPEAVIELCARRHALIIDGVVRVTVLGKQFARAMNYQIEVG